MKVISACFVNKLRLLCVSGLFCLLLSCASKDVMEVKQFHLRSIDMESMQQAPMVRGEQMHRMRGAVTIEERSQRLGQYYSVSWKNDGSATGPLKILMDYQQSATGSKVLTMSKDLPAGEEAGRVEFIISGESYRTNGRVLAWRIRMMSGSKVISEKRSYMWR